MIKYFKEIKYYLSEIHKDLAIITSYIEDCEKDKYDDEKHNIDRTEQTLDKIKNVLFDIKNAVKYEHK